MCKQMSGSDISGEGSDTRKNNIMNAPNVEEINDDYLPEKNCGFKFLKTVDRFDFSVHSCMSCIFLSLFFFGNKTYKQKISLSKQSGNFAPVMMILGYLVPVPKTHYIEN